MDHCNSIFAFAEWIDDCNIPMSCQAHIEETDFFRSQTQLGGGEHMQLPTPAISPKDIA